MVHTQQGKGTAHKLVENPGNRFLSHHKRKTEEEKEKGISQPLIHQKKDKLELCIISLIFFILKVTVSGLAKRLKA